MDFTGLIPTFGNFAFTAAAFVIALSVIVAIHEYGHYIVGRWSGIHAEVFSLGFGPVLWSRHDKHGTKWQIAALPFGGYVKFLGDADAASGKDGEVISALSEAELRRTMHGAPLWARSATVAAGPMFNFILSIAVFTVTALVIGVSSYPPVIDTIHPLPTEGIELQSGDRLIGIEGTPYPDIEDFAAFSDALPIKPLLEYTVLRDGSELVVKGPPLSPTRAATVRPSDPAYAAGMREGDVILSINGQKVTVFNDMIGIVNASEGRPITVKIWRAGVVSDLTIAPLRRDIPKPDNSFETRWIMGVNSSSFYTPALEPVGIGEALKIGGQSTWGIVTLSMSGLYHMITGAISSCNMSGPLGIAKASGQMASQGIADFVFFIALLSTAVGLLNLFPIPILDGGHLVFFAWEAVTGKPPSDKALRILMTAGLALLLLVMGFALSNDLFCP